jgi:hypothetical protein
MSILFTKSFEESHDISFAFLMIILEIWREIWGEWYWKRWAVEKKQGEFTLTSSSYDKTINKGITSC